MEWHKFNKTDIFQNYQAYVLCYLGETPSGEIYKEYAVGYYINGIFYPECDTSTCSMCNPYAWANIIECEV